MGIDLSGFLLIAAFVMIILVAMGFLLSGG